jgi:hypothetical protein
MTSIILNNPIIINKCYYPKILRYHNIELLKALTILTQNNLILIVNLTLIILVGNIGISYNYIIKIQKNNNWQLITVIAIKMFYIIHNYNNKSLKKYRIELFIL